MALVNDGQVLGSGSADLILNTRGKIYVRVGDRFYELDYKHGGDTNIVQNNTTVNPEQDLTPYVTKKYLKATLGEYITKRNWQDVMQTKEALENAQLEGFTESITPITVSTMQMVVGTQNLQFDFIASLTDDTLVPAGLFVNNSKQLVCPNAVIKHYTLFGPDSVKPDTKLTEYARWSIKDPEGNDYTILDLEIEDKPYYVYLKVPEYNLGDNPIGDDPKGTGIGQWVISTESFAMEQDRGYIYLLTAIVTGSNDGGRSIGYLNGFTEILPGQIRAYAFSTPDGKQFLDFQREKFKLGDERNFIDWNVTEKDTLTIKGNISVTGGELSDTLKNFAKKYNGEIELWFSTFAPETQTVPTLQNWPYTEWISKAEEYGRNVDSVINSHLYDLYFDINNGLVYQFLKQKEEYKWVDYSEIDPDKIEELKESLLSAYNPLYHLNAIYKKIEIVKDCIIKNPGLNSIIESITEKLQITQDDKELISKKTATLSLEIKELSSSIDNLLWNSNLDSDIIKSNVVSSHNVFNIAATKLLEIIQEYRDWELTDIESGFVDGSLEEEYEKYAVIANDFIAKLLILQDAIDSANKNVNANINAKFAKYGQHGSYLEEAFKQRTDIAGGLVLTSLIELGSSTKNPEDPDFYDEFTVKSGISGISKKEDDSDIAAWFGGPMVDKELDDYTDTIWYNNKTFYNDPSHNFKVSASMWQYKNETIFKESTRIYTYVDGIIEFAESGSWPEKVIKKMTVYNSEYAEDPVFKRNIYGDVLVDGTWYYCWNEFTTMNYHSRYTTTESPTRFSYIYKIEEKWNWDSDNTYTATRDLYSSVRSTENTTEQYITWNNKNYSKIGNNLSEFEFYCWASENNRIYFLDDLPTTNSLIYNNNVVLQQGARIDKYQYGYANSVFRMNGSGYLSGGNISWDSDGNLIADKITVNSGFIGGLVISGNSITNNKGDDEIISLSSDSAILSNATINGNLSTKLKGDGETNFISLNTKSNNSIIKINGSSLDTNVVPTYVYLDHGTTIWDGVVGQWWTTFTWRGTQKVFATTRSLFDGTLKIPEFTTNYWLFGNNAHGIINAYITDSSGFKVWEQSFGPYYGSRSGTNISIKIPEINITTSANRSYTMYFYMEGGIDGGTNTSCGFKVSVDSTAMGSIIYENDTATGLFLGANGLNISMGKNSTLQYLVPKVTIRDGEITTDNRNKGGIFKIMLPSSSDKSDLNKVVGIEIQGYTDLNGSIKTPSIKLNLGNDWRTLNVRSDGLLYLEND